jgi:hypothetical protein
MRAHRAPYGTSAQTPEQVAQAFGRRLGVAGRFEPTGLGTVTDPDSRAMFTWLGDPPAYRAELVTTRRLQPEIAGLEAFLAGSLSGSTWL